MGTSAVGTELSTMLSQLLDDVEINDLHRLSGGASRETWRFMADDRALILQRQRPGDQRNMLVEAGVVGAARRGGVPVPELIDARRRDDGMAFMVLEAIDGETIARKIQRDDEYSAARPRLAADFGHALAKIELVRNWLVDTRPVSQRMCVVHGDFRLGNIIVGPDGLRAVIDWELAHLGDPMEDLGWLCVKAWRFGGGPPVAGLGEYDELFAAYEEAGGAPVDPVVVHWWEVLGTWKWAIMCILQASVHLNGMTRSHELAAIGRRVCENEHDLLRSLEGRW